MSRDRGRTILALATLTLILTNITLPSLHATVNWSSDKRLTTDWHSDWSPSIAQISDGTIWFVWHSYRTGGSEIFYKTSTDGGLTWSSDTRLTKDPNFDLSPSVMQARDGKVWVVWDSDRNSINGIPQSDVFYKIYDGAEWSTDTPLTADTSDDIMPSLIHASNLTIWIAWASNRNYNYDIYYKTCDDFSLIHDITLVSVSASPTDVYLGRSINVTVTLKNTGTVSETSNVTAYYDGVAIGTQTVSDLAPAYITNASITLNFTWDTLDVLPGYHVISATAEPVPNEAYVGDNSLADGTIHIRILGDVNGNDEVDIYDGLVLVEHFGQPASAYPEADIDGDGFINIYDATYTVQTLVKQFHRP